MKIKTMVCPHCGAQLKIVRGKNYAICEYCDSEVFIEDEVRDPIDQEEAGYRFEKGRQRAREESEKKNKASCLGADNSHRAGGDSSGVRYYQTTQSTQRTQSTQGTQGTYNYYGNNAGAYPASPKSRLVALLLCIFLGCFGVHRFYMGRIGLGILYLFTFSLFGFGYIIDIILIALGKARDRNGLYLINW